MERNERNNVKQSSKLVLNRETLRELTTEEARKVVGKVGLISCLSRCRTQCTTL